jgi:hypothetical protein
MSGNNDKSHAEMRNATWRGRLPDLLNRTGSTSTRERALPTGEGGGKPPTLSQEVERVYQRARLRQYVEDEGICETCKHEKPCKLKQSDWRYAVEYCQAYQEYKEIIQDTD